MHHLLCCFVRLIWPHWLYLLFPFIQYSYADGISEPIEIDPSECVSLHVSSVILIINTSKKTVEFWDFSEKRSILFLQECRSNMPFRFSSVGNWLQCQQVLDGPGDGLDGAICGKWRR